MDCHRPHKKRSKWKYQSQTLQNSGTSGHIKIYRDCDELIARRNDDFYDWLEQFNN